MLFFPWNNLAARQFSNYFFQLGRLKRFGRNGMGSYFVGGLNSALGFYESPNNALARIILFLGVLFPAFIGISGPALAKATAPVTATVVVLKHFPPEYITTDGKPDGLAVDFIKAVAKVGGFNIRYLTVNSWAEGAKAIVGGKADIFPNVGISDKRRAFLDFTVPYETLHISLFVRENIIDIKGLKNLSGKILGVQKTNVLTPRFEKNPAIKLIKYKTFQEAFLSLLSGTVDAVPAPEDEFWKIAKEAELAGRIKIVGSPLLEVKRSMAVRKGNSIWLDRLNKAIKKIITTSKYQEIMTKWHGRPLPYWTFKRIFSVVVALFIILFIAALFWKNISTQSVNKKLVRTKNNLLQTTHNLKRLIYIEKELNNILSRISRGDELSEILSDICVISEFTERSSLCSILLLDTKESCLRHGAAPNLPDSYIEAVDGLKIGPSVGSCGTAAFKGETVVVEDIFTHPYWAEYKEMAEKAGLQACWSEPIHSSGGEILGTFNLYYKNTRIPKKKELKFIKSQANLAGIAIERNQNLRAIEQKEEALLTARNEAVESRKYAEKALSDLHEQKFVLDNHAIVATIDPRGIITYVNDKFVEISKYTKEELIGQNHNILNSDYHPPEFFQDIWKTISSGHVWKGEVRNKAKDGSLYWVAATIAPMMNEEGEITKYISARTDITERKLAEERLRRIQKMEAVGQLSGGIAHDFNNILSIVMGNLELLQRIIADNPKALGRVETALRGIKRGAALTRKLLAFSRKDSRGVSRISANTFIESMNDLIVKSLTVSIKVENRLADDLWPVIIDPGDLEDVILNLALNARDAMPDGGILSIETLNKVFDGDFIKHNPGSKVGEYVMISIGDTGVGMTPEVVEKAFDPFFSTKDESRGTGLGLSMVYGFVQRSGGYIKIYSEPGRGTTLRIYLPRAEKEMEESEVAGPRRQEPQQGSETILIVDDEQALSEVAASHLESLGYSTVTANNGKQALEIIQEHPDIDLIFSDVVMPGGVDGYQLATEALKEYPSLKVLLTSGFTKKQKNIVNCDTLIIDNLKSAMLSKPYTRAELAMSIRRTLDGVPGN